MVAVTAETAAPFELDFRSALRNAHTPRVRTMRQFAEQEIILPPGGPWAGRFYNCKRQPANGLWFDGIDSGRWTRHWATGPSQAAKTLCCFAIPAIYHLFELRETVVCGVPNLDMVSDKWHNDLRPVIANSRYRSMLPDAGRSSRGGIGVSVRFTNGSMLRFMTGGGGDKSRAGFTTRVLIITEADGFDSTTGGSDEADKITQMLARLRSRGDDEVRVYGESTVTVEAGRTWHEITKNGTNSRIALPCPHCRKFCIPKGDESDRLVLRGWQDAASKLDARDRARFCCALCGAEWSETERREANLAGVLVHGDQTVRPNGKIVGDPPRTDTFGLRWSAVNNLFRSAGDAGADEWRAARSPDEESAEREINQFVWALPYRPPVVEVSPLDAAQLARRTSGTTKGIVPAGTKALTVGVDLGSRLLHYVAVAWRQDASSDVIDYGCVDVQSEQLGVPRAILIALRELAEFVTDGWQPADSTTTRPADQVWIDAGWETDVVYQFCREAGKRFRPVMGRGTSSIRPTPYIRPTRTGAIVQFIGEAYHAKRLKNDRLHVIEIDSNHWKLRIRQQLSSDPTAPGAMRLYQALNSREHQTFIKHLRAEHPEERFVPGRGGGVQIRWVRRYRNNHWFDALYYAAAAAHLCGVRIEPDDKRPGKQQRPAFVRTGVKTRDGRPFMITERK